jgi:hypothetical protein
VATLERLAKAQTTSPLSEDAVRRWMAAASVSASFFSQAVVFYNLSDVNLARRISEGLIRRDDATI